MSTLLAADPSYSTRPTQSHLLLWIVIGLLALLLLYSCAITTAYIRQRVTGRVSVFLYCVTTELLQYVSVYYHQYTHTRFQCVGVKESNHSNQPKYEEPQPFQCEMFHPEHFDSSSVCAQMQKKKKKRQTLFWLLWSQSNGATNWVTGKVEAAVKTWNPKLATLIQKHNKHQINKFISHCAIQYCTMLC